MLLCEKSLPQREVSQSKPGGCGCGHTSFQAGPGPKSVHTGHSFCHHLQSRTGLLSSEGEVSTTVAPALMMTKAPGDLLSMCIWDAVWATVQEAVLSAGCIPALIKLASSGNDELRLNAVWALQNLVYQANSDVRKALLEALPWIQAMDLLCDIRSEVQVSAMHVGQTIKSPASSICSAAKEVV